MAKTKKIKNFVKVQCNEMQANLAALCHAANSEKLHTLRVNVKKTKAVVSLLKTTSSHKKNISIKKLKELFDHAGKIRTAQLNVEALLANDIENENLAKEQTAIIESESSELFKRKKTYNKNIKRLKKSILFNANRIKTKSIHIYYNKQIEELKLNFTLPVKEELLHRNRKIIKKLLLPLKALPKSIQDEINIDKKYFDDLQDKIGNWHDTVIALDLLKQESQGYQLLNDKRQKQLNEIENLGRFINEHSGLPKVTP